MPSINAQARKKVFKGLEALENLDGYLRHICALALSTRDNKLKRSSGLIVNISKPAWIDPRFDLFLEIKGYGEPEVSGRDIEIIVAQIKADLAHFYPKIRFGGWVKVGLDERWFSSHEETKSVAEIKVQRYLAMPISELIADGDDFASRNLHTRTYKRLEREGIMTVGQLVQMTEADLLSYTNFGDQGLEIVKTKLYALELKLKEA